MWLVAIVLALGGLAIVSFSVRGSRGLRHGDLGFMSQQWLAEYRAGHRS